MNANAFRHFYDYHFDKPVDGEDKDLMLWQVLLHVANDGTDHRAQLLRLHFQRL